MTLGELKKKTLSLIEEIDMEEENLTSDPDIAAKLPYVINQILHELARFKKISAYTTLEVEKDDVLNLEDALDNFYQLHNIRGVKFEFIDDVSVRFLADGEATISYYQYPDNITENTSDAKRINLSEDALEIAPYGIAGDLLKSDVSTGYGQIYSNRYQQLLQMLDSRYTQPIIEFENGIDL